MRILAVAALTLLATPALADPVPGATTVADKPAKPAEDKKVCRSIESSSSRLGSRKVCKTAAQWRSDDLLLQNNLEGSQRDQ